MSHKFRYRTLEELDSAFRNLNLTLPVAENVSILREAVCLSNKVKLPNRFAIHPMEGSDAGCDGSPGELTKRRYLRYASGGAGLIWFEAVAVNEQGRANDKQLFLHKHNLDHFARLAGQVREESIRCKTGGIPPYLVLQLTHAGRFGENKKILFHHGPLDGAAGVAPDQEIMNDSELSTLSDDYVRTSELARRAGFDAVDIKSCHRYLISENLAAHTRRGRFGGAYANRTGILKTIVRRIHSEVGMDVAVRLNAWDGLPFPYGWGADEEGEPDLSEPKKLVSELDEMGVILLNISAGSPYYNSDITRPHNSSHENPLQGVHRLLTMARELKKQVKKALVVGTGFSWFRHFAPQFASGVIGEDWIDIAGFGRQAFAYPDFARDVFNRGIFVPQKVCLTCSKCAELKSKKVPAGCVVRDGEVYPPVD